MALFELFKSGNSSHTFEFAAVKMDLEEKDQSVDLGDRAADLSQQFAMLIELGQCPSNLKLLIPLRHDMSRLKQIFEKNNKPFGLHIIVDESAYPIEQDFDTKIIKDTIEILQGRYCPPKFHVNIILLEDLLAEAIKNHTLLLNKPNLPPNSLEVTLKSFEWNYENFFKSHPTTVFFPSAFKINFELSELRIAQIIFLISLLPNPACPSD